MRPFYLNGMLRALVLALVGIFTPIYIFKLGGLGWVVLFYLVTRLTTLLLAIPISKLIESIGFRRSIATSLFFLITCYVALLLAPANTKLVILAAIASGINIPLYWVARSSAISQDSTRGKVGTQMGMMTTFEQVATMLGPLTAGLVIERWGFTTMYGLALILLVISIVPLWSMPPHSHRNGASWEGFGRWVTNRRYFHNGVGIGARAVDDYAINVLWPLAIFGLGVRTGVVGGLFSLVAIAGLIVRLLIGKMFDRMHSRGDYSDEWMFGVSAAMSSLLWIARIFARTIGVIAGVDLIGALFGTAYSSLYVDYEQLGGKRMGSMAYWVYGEMMYSIMTIVLFGAVAWGWYFGIWREVFMLMASFWVLISIVLARESNMK